MLFSSIARMNPVIVTASAVSLMYEGMVICCTDMGGMLFVIINPAKMLPIARRLIGLSKHGLFSLMEIVV